MISRREFMAQAAGLVSACGLKLPLWERAAHFSGTGTVVERPLLLGVDYYPDQTPENLWEEDARMISEAGLTNVRVAEFAWALLEPSEGKLEFNWLHRSIDLLHKHSIAVILGTPSAAPPPWLSEKYPEILMVNDHGTIVRPGGRRFTCPTNKIYRKLSLNIATEMAKAFADTAGVIGWQVDNEFTLQTFARCYCNYCRAGFQDWARQKYGSLDNLNQKWGTSFWSQTYTGWEQIPLPLPSNGEPNPGLVLDYNRYQSYANASFAGAQVAVLRKLCPRHFITTNNVGAPLDTLDLRELYHDMDFVSHDNYPGFMQMFMPSDMTTANLALISAMGHDSMRSIKAKPFLIMEEQSGKAGQSFFTPQPHPGQLRLWAFQAIAHGAMGVNYFRWDTAKFGAEEYWHGMLNHDRTKSPGFDEMVETVKAMKALGREALESSYVAETALSFDLDSDWALAVQPGNRKLSYREQLMMWYSALASANTGTDLIHLDEDLSKYKAVFAPVQYVLGERQAENIRKYVRRGGTFVAGFRLGVKDENSRIVDMPLPGLLRDVMGVTVKDYLPVYAEKVGVKLGPELGGADAQCVLWADLLTPQSATVLARYTGPYEGEAAITVNSFGQGKAIYVGADLDPTSLARVLRSILSMSNSRSDFDAPTGVEVTRRRSAAREWVFVLNHTSGAQRVPLPRRFDSVVGGRISEGTLFLKGYEISVLQLKA
jgi:beta-galactosidase